MKYKVILKSGESIIKEEQLRSGVLSSMASIKNGYIALHGYIYHVLYYIISKDTVCIYVEKCETVYL